MHKPVLVFDTVTLSNFLVSGEIDLVISHYKNRMVLTWEVYDELCAGFASVPGLSVIDELVNLKSVVLITLTQPERRMYQELVSSMGKGESSVLAAAYTRHYHIATDDKSARRHSDRLKVQYTGTVGILLALCQDKKITVAKADLLLSIMIKAGFYSPVSSISQISQG